MKEARQAVLAGPEEARWYAESLRLLYGAGFADQKGSIGEALSAATAGCDDPWRTQLQEYLRTSAEVLNNIAPHLETGSGSSKAADPARLLGQLDLSARSASRVGSKRQRKPSVPGADLVVK
jgi:hypothetical protein